MTIIEDQANATFTGDGEWSFVSMTSRRDITDHLKTAKKAVGGPTPVDVPVPEKWQTLSACSTVPNAAEIFFSEEVPAIAEAKAICRECPVLAACLEEALRRREPCGVWGGQLFVDGVVTHTKRRRGRPPKVARPEDQLPEVPVPPHLQRLIA